jgi:hypothetical protein
MADEPKPTSNTASTTTKTGSSKADAMSKAADMLYGMGERTRGARNPGKFVSIGGFFAYGTHRDGRKGVMFGKKFFPTSNSTSKTTSNATSNTSSSTTTPSKVAPTPSASLLKKKGSWSETMRENFPSSFKHGGLVRGAGKAMRGRGRGRNV